MTDLAAQFRALVDALPDAVVVHNAGRFVFLNEAALRMLGYDRADELIGEPVSLRSPATSGCCDGMGRCSWRAFGPSP